MSEITENKIYYWLSMSGIGSKKLNAALSMCPADELYHSLPQDKALKDFFGEKYTAILLQTRNTESLDENLYAIARQGIRIITLADENYPIALRQSEVSPPLALYYKGNKECLNAPCIAIIGTRAVSQYGKEVAKEFAQEFAKAGVTVVSGLATGVDSYAHAASAEIGKTAAVLGGGLKFISAYSAVLSDKIVDGGGIILTEYPPDFSPTKYSFPERNRIISGLSSALVVVEAGEKSGTLITVDFALEQGRGIYAVPGGIYSSKSIGCNTLIKNGYASIALRPQDILSDLRINFLDSASKKTCIILDFYEQKIYNLLQSGKKHYDELITSSGFSAAELSILLLSLEMKGAVRRLPSNFYRLEGIDN